MFTPKVQTPENTITRNYTKDELDKQKSFVMCPTQGCKAELKGSWKDYEVYIKDKNGKKVQKKDNGLQVYRCPACKQEFTVNNFSVNSIPVPDFDGIGVLTRGNSGKIEFTVNGFERFKDSDDLTYVYLPLKYSLENFRFFYIPVDSPEVSVEDLENLLKEHLKTLEKK